MPSSLPGNPEQGSGIAEFDDILRDHMDELNDLMGKNTEKAEKELKDKFEGYIKDAKDKIDDSDRSQSEKEAAKKELDAIGDEIESEIDRAGPDGADISTAATPIQLSEIKSVKYIDDNTREVTLHDGRILTVDASINGDAFDIVKDFENQLRVVQAEAGPLLAAGYGLMGDNELGGLTINMMNARTPPIIKHHGNNIVSVEYIDGDGNQRRYFAYNGHSQKAFDAIPGLAVMATVLWLRRNEEAHPSDGDLNPDSKGG